MPLLAPTPENFRVIIARHRLRREEICRHIRMNLNMLTMFVNGVRPLPEWAAHNVGLAINQEVGRRIFRIDETLGVVPPTTARRTYVRPEPPPPPEPEPEPSPQRMPVYVSPQKTKRRRQKSKRTFSGPMFSPEEGSSVTA